MSTPSQDGKHPVSPLLAGPYGHPLHPLLVTVPIGAWVASLVFDIGSHVAGRGSVLADGSLWLIAVGVLGALAAAGVGFLDLFAIPTGTRAFRTGLVHMSLNLTVTVAYAIGFAWRRGGYGHSASVGAGQLALSAVSLAVLAVSGFLGGKLAYRYGVRVAAESVQREGLEPTSATPSIPLPTTRK
ncbi:DUF2231 domain-containing protein [Actinocrinis sp.]|uniref:DUF2231 domain-containing protein n=1 Tax=Actinocrinis sp. TaxID=1920516 RepID=UPI002D3CDF90|nr:DUF2231 domain-containing protein [Actinocrinis sp.]HZP49883.1 DUF2231 domain-containing protein [Actinocrinis sp.]